MRSLCTEAEGRAVSDSSLFFYYVHRYGISNACTNQIGISPAAPYVLMDRINE
jgi:hypothetical protein